MYFSKYGLLAWVSYTGDLGLPIRTPSYEHDEPLGPDVDQATFDGKHFSMNGYNGIWEVIKSVEWAQLLHDGNGDFGSDGRGQRLQ